MSDLSRLCDQLNDTQGAIEQLERAMAQFPAMDIPASLFLTRKSLDARFSQLEQEYLARCAQMGVDICSYRLLSEHKRPTVKAVAETTGGFQNLLSIVYDCLKNGPKSRQRVSADVALETELDFGYAFAGSLGFVFSLQNQRMLPGFESNLDDSFRSIFRMLEIKDAQSVKAEVQRLGLASISAFYRWLVAHVEGGVSVGIDWQRNREIRASAIAQLNQLIRLQELIGSVSDQSATTFRVAGTLLGADSNPKRFHFKTDKNEEFRGTYEDAISPALHPELYKKYMATIEKIEVTHYATDEVDVSYHLKKLTDLHIRPYEDSEDEPTDR
jgi:hypothetical protein